jgi:hypothetical protein
VGNFNPLLIGELFWEQSTKWQILAINHLDQVDRVCRRFLKDLLEDKCPKDIHARLWPHQIQDVLKLRHEDAVRELNLLITDIKEYPINYSHYYTDTIKKRRQSRGNDALAQCIKDATQHKKLEGCHSSHTSASVNVEIAIKKYTERVNPDMEEHSYEEALDCLFAIYKVNLLSLFRFEIDHL